MFTTRKIVVRGALGEMELLTMLLLRIYRLKILRRLRRSFCWTCDLSTSYPADTFTTLSVKHLLYWSQQGHWYRDIAILWSNLLTRLESRENARIC